MSAVVTDMTRSSPFHQRHAAVVPVHEKRGAKTDGEIDRHRNGNYLDRLPGLIEDGSGEYLDQIRIADEDRKRGILRQIEILAGERRNDDPHRLRNDDETHRRSRTQAERIGSLGLTVRDGEN